MGSASAARTAVLRLCRRAQPHQPVPSSHPVVSECQCCGEPLFLKLHDRQKCDIDGFVSCPLGFSNASTPKQQPQTERPGQNTACTEKKHTACTPIQNRLRKPYA